MATEDDLTVAVGDWMLLCSSPSGNVFRWYRVVSVDEVLQPGATFQRDVTLAGPDWNWGPSAQGVLFTRLITVRTETVISN